jgi:hypothetical protein
MLILGMFIFMNFIFSLFRVISLILISHQTLAADFDTEYDQGDKISSEIFVTNKSGSQVHLAALLKEAESGINVLFIFGGGDMGSGMPGHLWCPDSFEDTHILRTLYSKYQDMGVNFIPVAAAPAYHTQMLGHKADVFFTDATGSEEFKTAEQAFIDSTLASFDSGILPVEPYMDSRFRLMFNRSPELVPENAYGDILSWQGVFRDPEETQFYGVPSFWILGAGGEILSAPFRGNIYHPHGADVSIKYTFSDIDDALQGLLEN